MNGQIKVRNWDKWQSYRKDRGQPPWIKIHRCVMRNLEWVSLTDAERGQLVAIWLLAADHDGVIPASSKILQKICFMSSEPNINKFRELGFLCHTDVNVTSTRRQRDQPETETETDTKAEAETDNEHFNPLDFFESFWNLYDKKVDRKKCEQKFKKLKHKDVDKIFSTVELYIKANPDKEFRKNPLTYLNGECWMDEIIFKEKNNGNGGDYVF